MKKILIGFALALMASGAAHAADLGGKLLKVGSDTTSPPMESIDTATGQIVGFDVDVVNAVCAKINCKAEFVTTGWDGIFAALDQGSFDLVASGVSITEERKKAMDFSEPYIVNSQAILMRVEDEGLTADDFKTKGKKLSAQANTTDAQVAEGIVGKYNVIAYDSFAASLIASTASSSTAPTPPPTRRNSPASWSCRSATCNPTRSASSSARATRTSPPSTRASRRSRPTAASMR